MSNVWKPFAQVNFTDEGAFQGDGQIAALADGGYFITWSDDSNVFKPGSVIVGQRFDILGRPVGAEMQVSQFADLTQHSSAITTFADGGVAVAYNDDVGGGDTDIYVRRFDASFEHSTNITIDFSTDAAGEPSITAFQDGGFVVAYTLNDANLVGRSVTAAGVVSDPFIIDDTIPDKLNYELATLSNGNFVTVYQAEASPRIWYAVKTQAGSTVIGPAVAHDDSGMGFFGYDPDVAALPGGGFVVVWTDDDGAATDGDGEAIRGTIYDENGINVVVGGFQINTANTTGNQNEASVTAFEDGSFLVTWEDDFADRVRARKFDSLGNPLTDEFVVKGGVGTDSPDSAVLGDGRIALVLGDVSTGDANVTAGILDLRESPIDGTGDDDRITSRRDGATVNGLGGNDDLFGSQVSDTLNGDGGNDVIDGSGGVDTMAGGLGDDTFWVDRSADAVIEVAGQGNDIVYSTTSFTLAAGQEIEVLQGILVGAGAATAGLTLTGNGFNNVIIGTGRADNLDGGVGIDTIVGGSGDDFMFVDNAADVVVEALGGGSDRVFAGVSYTLGAGQEVEKLTTTNLVGTSAINLTGNELANIIFGNNGANTLDGKGGVDNLNGLAGDDFYFVDNALDVVNEAVGGGSDRVFTSVSYTLKAGQEVEKLTTDSNGGTGAINLTGNELANIIYGNAGANSLDGKAGADNLNGLGGDDFYYVDNALDVVSEVVGDGSDRVFASVSYTLKAGQEIEKLTTASNLGTGAINLTGNETVNTIFGNAGDNLLNGGGGNDSLIGLGGADTFVFNTALNAATNHDTLSDLAVAEDHIQLAKSVFSLLTGAVGATLAAGEFVSGAGLTNAQDANDRIVYNTTTGDLYYDTNGTAAGATLFATLSNHAAVNNTHFVLG